MLPRELVLHDPILTLVALTALYRLWASGRFETAYSHHAVCYVLDVRFGVVTTPREG